MIGVAILPSVPLNDASKPAWEDNQGPRRRNFQHHLQSTDEARHSNSVNQKFRLIRHRVVGAWKVRKLVARRYLTSRRCRLVLLRALADLEFDRSNYHGLK